MVFERVELRCEREMEEEEVKEEEKKRKERRKFVSLKRHFRHSDSTFEQNVLSKSVVS